MEAAGSLSSFPHEASQFSQATPNQLIPSWCGFSKDVALESVIVLSENKGISICDDFSPCLDVEILEGGVFECEFDEPLFCESLITYPP